jgi:hypothetical protein
MASFNYPGDSPREMLHKMRYHRVLVPIGATGAVGTLTKDRAISTVVRDSQGVYTITLDEPFPALWEARVTIFEADDPGVWGNPSAEDVDNSTTPTVEFKFRNSAGTLTDPPDGSTLQICLVLKNAETY